MDTRVRPLALRSRILEARANANASSAAVEAALDANAGADVRRAFPALASSIIELMDAEEAYAFATARGISSRDTNILIHEHRHLRARLLTIGGDADKGHLRSVRIFLDELRAHARSEASRGWVRDLAANADD